jgi:hypothetical protein
MPSPIAKNNINASQKAMVNRSLTNLGNSYRINRIFQKAKQGQTISVAFVGSSAFSKDEEEDVSVEKETISLLQNFLGKKVHIKSLNLNVYGSSSRLGYILLKKEILSNNPDIIIIDYAVFDKHEQEDRESFETIIRTCLEQENEPQVIVFLNTKSDIPTKQEGMEQIAKYYNLPVINVSNSILSEISSGRIKPEEIFVDAVNYTEKGKKTLASFLYNYFKQAANCKDEEYTIPKPMYSISENSKIKTIDAMNISADNDGSYVRGKSNNALFKTKAEYLTKTQNLPFVFTIEATNVYLIAPISKYRPNIVEIYENDKKTKEIDTYSEELYDVPQVFKIYSNNKPEKVTISIKIKENTETLEKENISPQDKKDFEFWAIAYN